MINQLVSIIKQSLQGNQFFAGGLLLGVIGGIIALLHRLPRLLWNSFLRRITVTIEVTNQQDAFYWIQKWLAVQGYTKRARRWLITSGSRHREVERAEGSSSLRRPEEPPITLAPAPGQHFFRYHGRWVWLAYNREPMKVGGATLGFLDTMVLRIFGWDQTVAKRLLQEAYNLAVPREYGQVTTYVALWGNWRTLESQDARPLDSLIFDDNIADQLYDDVKQFQESKSWYNQKGIPYRRGYFLCGPPGNGKSSLIMALAGKLEMNIAVLPLGWTSSDQQLQDLMFDLPQGTLLLIEDIDKINFNEQKDKDSEGVTLSGLLNVIDGIVARQDRILFMTANNGEELHPALLRPGRIDVRTTLDNASHSQVEGMFNRFYGAQCGLVEEFLQHVLSGEVSMAALQEHFVRYRDEPEIAVKNVQELLE